MQCHTAAAVAAVVVLIVGLGASVVVFMRSCSLHRIREVHAEVQDVEMDPECQIQKRRFLQFFFLVLGLRRDMKPAMFAHVSCVSSGWITGRKLQKNERNDKTDVRN